MNRTLICIAAGVLLAACATKRKTVTNDEYRHTEAATVAIRADTSQHRADTTTRATESTERTVRADTLTEHIRAARWVATDTVTRTDTVFTEIWHTITRVADQYATAGTWDTACAVGDHRTRTEADMANASTTTTTTAKTVSETRPATGWKRLALILAVALIAAALAWVAGRKQT